MSNSTKGDEIVAINILCLLGLHAWRNWEYDEKTKCHQTRICKRSNTHQQFRELHDWNLVTKESDPDCENCDGTGTVVFKPVRGAKYHQNTLPAEAFGGVPCGCHKYYICQRCNEVKRIKVSPGY